jgi:hypothetical protein
MGMPATKLKRQAILPRRTTEGGGFRPIKTPRKNVNGKLIPAPVGGITFGSVPSVEGVLARRR